jgi:hypothetical protein
VINSSINEEEWDVEISGRQHEVSEDDLEFIKLKWMGI